LCQKGTSIRRWLDLANLTDYHLHKAIASIGTKLESISRHCKVEIATALTLTSWAWQLFHIQPSLMQMIPQGLSCFIHVKRINSEWFTESVVYTIKRKVEKSIDNNLTVPKWQDKRILEEFNAADQASTLQYIRKTNIEGTVFQRYGGPL